MLSAGCAFSLLRYLVSVEGAEHVVHVGVLLLRGAAGDTEDLLELVEVQVTARAFAGELSVELLDVLESHLLL